MRRTRSMRRRLHHRGQGSHRRNSCQANGSTAGACRRNRSRWRRSCERRPSVGARQSSAGGASSKSSTMSWGARVTKKALRVWGGGGTYPFASRSVRGFPRRRWSRPEQASADRTPTAKCSTPTAKSSSHPSHPRRPRRPWPAPRAPQVPPADRRGTLECCWWASARCTPRSLLG